MDSRFECKTNFEEVQPSNTGNRDSRMGTFQRHNGHNGAASSDDALEDLYCVEQEVEMK